MQIEDPKQALILFGGKTSQITKDVLSDLHKLKAAVSHCLLLVMKDNDIIACMIAFASCGMSASLKHFSSAGRLGKIHEEK